MTCAARKEKESEIYHGRGRGMGKREGKIEIDMSYEDKWTGQDRTGQHRRWRLEEGHTT